MRSSMTRRIVWIRRSWFTRRIRWIRRASMFANMF